MEGARTLKRRIVWLILPIIAPALTGCAVMQVAEKEANIAQSGIPIETSKTSLPEYVIEPPDIVQVEVLEALPGRPITGERLVRPDGTISLEFYGNVYVAGLTPTEAKEKIILHLRKYLTDEVLGLIDEDTETEKPKVVDPKESDRVFVDVTAYNSKVYYVQGDVAAPGRLPITGNETVLDALNYAGGLAPTAQVSHIDLVRPAPPGACCEQTLRVNYAAIINKGDPTTNYQLMPGDRLVVYRDPIVRSTIFLDRLAAPFNTVVNSILTYSFAARYVNLIGSGNGNLGNGTNTNNSSTTNTLGPAR
jgi:polysaccharide export outer membrane protein